MPEEKSEEQKKSDENVVYVGKKNTRGYVLAVITQFSNGMNEVCIKARGKLISKAVDVSQIVMNKFMPNCKIEDVKLSTESITTEDGKSSNVSAISIVLRKTD